MDLKVKGEKIKMPSISKIRFTNAIYDNGEKRYNDELFIFDGYNGAILLENGGGKTTFIQIALQAILPHADLGDRKIRETLSLDGTPCHVAIEWIINEVPRRYALTCVTLFLNNGKLDSYKYVYEYGHNDENSIENIPFVKGTIDGKERPASKEEMGDYYQYMCRENINSKIFPTIKAYHKYIEENFKIIPKEWRRIGIINGEEGDVDEFFEGCKSTTNLVDKLLIPTVEEAMAGNGAEDFADTFEEQREHFKQHNRLRKSIDESKEIQNKIEEYVNIYNEYNNSIEEYSRWKSYGKAVYKYISNEEEDIKIKLDENEAYQNKYEEDSIELERMKDSYRLNSLKNQLLISKLKYEEILKDYEIIKDELDAKEANIQNLKIAKYKKDIKELEDEISLYKKQLENLKKDEEISEIQEELKLNSSNIKNYYSLELEKLNEDINKLNNKEKTYEKELEKFQIDKSKLDREWDKLNEEIIRLNQDIKNNKRYMEKINKEILSNIETEKIENEYPKWTKKVGCIEKYLVDCQENINSIKDEKESIKIELIKYREAIDKLSSDKATVVEKINNIENEEKDLLLTIKEYIPNLFHINSIYTKQEQIINTLENRCEKLRKEKENLIIEERIVHRFIDDYEDNKYFTAEPLLGKWVEQWKDQFSFLESGFEFIERVAATTNKNQKEYYKLYPYWAMGIIVADNEKNKLKVKLENNLDKITYPIIILSQSNAQSIIRNKYEIEDDYIYLYPSIWENNIGITDFKYNKFEIGKKAEVVTQNRKDKENELNSYDNLHINTIEFLNKYPYKDYLMPLKNELKNIEEKMYNIKNIYKEKSKRIEEIDDELENINNEIKKSNEEKNILNNNIEKALNYIRKKREIDVIKKEVSQLKNIKDKKKIAISRLDKLIKNSEQGIAKLKDRINDKNKQADSIINSELYIEVKDSIPIYSNISIEVLKKERIDIKDRLDRKQKNRSFIEDNKNRSLKTIKKYEKSLKNEIKSAIYPIDEKMVFPLHGEDEIEELINDIRELRPKVHEIEKKKDSVKEEYFNNQNEYDFNEEIFFKKHHSIMEFTEPLDIIKERINEKKRELDKRYEYLIETEKELNSEYNSIKEALNFLERKDERYSYLTNEIKPDVLSEEITTELSYNRKKYIDELIKALEDISYKVEDKEKKVSKEKSRFESFCEDSIKEPRLKNMAISGINYKDSFEELVKWKRIIDKNIDRNIGILEEDMMQHDKEINQFINHLHSYLKTLADEIRTISNKTRIKVDDNWKAVYIIDVPDWEDEVGKERLIESINYLLKDIEDIGFKDEDGNENKASVRKYIENRFQGKELLRVVMGNDKIKVRCRKVTNDGKVSSRPISWEQSNKWSGGEKWSKNMTLFLGILNYLAEKSQSIPYNQKRSRTVLLDNPFGKASSDHVLDPVFFIAEQLGFQIIALTAHSEGKYIRDFFPVVYSCRLRPSVDKKTQIIGKEKEIRYAFFKDKDPQALIRLGDAE